MQRNHLFWMKMHSSICKSIVQIQFRCITFQFHHLDTFYTHCGLLSSNLIWLFEQEVQLLKCWFTIRSLLKFSLVQLLCECASHLKYSVLSSFLKSKTQRSRACFDRKRWILLDLKRTSGPFNVEYFTSHFGQL